jgi:hypothetical protein
MLKQKKKKWQDSCGLTLQAGHFNHWHTKIKCTNPQNMLEDLASNMNLPLTKILLLGSS